MFSSSLRMRGTNAAESSARWVFVEIPPVFIYIIHVKFRINSNAKALIYYFMCEDHLKIPTKQENTLESDCDEISQWLEVLRTHWRVAMYWEFMVEMAFYHAEPGLEWSSYYFPVPTYGWYAHKTLISYHLSAFKS